MVQSMLGLVPLGAINTLLVDPALPDWMPEMTVRGLRVGLATVTLRFWRTRSGSSRWKVLHKEGKLRVVRQPAPESLSAGWLQRLKGLFESI